MTIVRVGTNQKYAAGWESAFGGKGKKRAKAVVGSKKKATAGKPKKSTSATKRKAKK